MSASTVDAVSVQNYLAGRLSPSECETFEARLLTDAGLVRDLEESLRFREGLEQLREQGVLDSLTRRRSRALSARTRWAAAAAVVVIGAVAALHWGTRLGERPSPLVAASVDAFRVGSAPALRVTGRYTFAATRDAASTPEITLPTSGALELRILAPITDVSRTFRVTLSSTAAQSPKPNESVQHVLPDADGFTVIYADVSRLEPGDYSLDVDPEGKGNDAAGERFAFILKRIGN